MIKFAFQNWNVEYNWWCPNTVPHDFVVDGKKQLPITHEWQWFDLHTIPDLDSAKVEKAFAASARRNDFLYHGGCNVYYSILDELAGKEKYIFPIMIRNTSYFILNQNTGFDLIDPRVFVDVHNNKAKIVLMLPYEGTSGAEVWTEDYNTLNNWCKKYNLKHDQVYYINGNFKSAELSKGMNFTSIPVNSFISWVPWIPDQPISYKPNGQQNLFLSYNRRPRPHRTILMLELIRAGLLDRGKISYSGDNLKNTHWRITEPLINRPDLAREAEILDSLIPIELDMDLINNNPANNLEGQHYESTFVSLVPETLFDKNAIFFSEKTWKTIAAGHPFFLVSSPGMLAELRNMGFYTYGSFWDESYDNTESIHEKILQIVGELKKLSHLSDDKLLSLRRDMQGIIEHNQRHFRSMWWNSRRNDSQHDLLEKVQEIWNSY